MAQDPEQDPESEFDDEQPEAEGEVDLSSDLDMVPLFESQTIDAEMESDIIRSILETNGIQCVVQGSPFTSLGYQVRVPRAQLQEARRLIAEQQAAGPEAAAEAEAASEESQ
jgi:hypothetical protein